MSISLFLYDYVNVNVNICTNNWHVSNQLFTTKQSTENNCIRTYIFLNARTLFLHTSKHVRVKINIKLYVYIQ